MAAWQVSLNEVGNRVRSHLEVIPLRLGSVEYLDRELTARHDHKRRVVKVFLKLPGIECGTHDNDLQVLSIA